MAQQFEPAEVFDIDDLDTLRLIVDEPRIQIIESLGRPHSVAEVAEALDVPRTRLYHHFNLLEQAGVITVVDERRAGAVTEKLYQVSARSYRPSPKFTETASPREQAAAVLDSLFATTRTDFVEAVERDRISLQDDDDRRSLALSRRLLTLSSDRAHELIERIEALLSEFEDSDGESAYGVTVVVHPSSRNLT